jgi:carbamoyl-phosphate synthase large subunit
VPFVAKAVGSPIAAIAVRVMAGEPLSAFTLKSPETAHISVKEAVMPFNRFPGVDTLLGPEMRSTGEVMGIDTSFSRAFLKAQLGAGTALPESGTAFVSVKDGDKNGLIVEASRILHELGFRLVATAGTARFLALHQIPAARVNKVYEGRPHVVDLMKDGGVQVVFNTTEGAQSIADSREIRALALSGRIPYYTTAAGSRAAALAMRNRLEGELEVTALQDYAAAGVADAQAKPARLIPANR